jgi:uncharacterized protein YjbI with pentapeptide repeats
MDAQNEALTALESPPVAPAMPMNFGTAMAGIPLDAGQVSLAGRDLRDWDFTGVDLEGADLSGCDLAGAHLFQAQLRNVNLSRANLTGTEFSGADLSGANLQDAQATNAGFGMAVLRGAKLFGAKLDGATFSKADLTGADLRCASLAGARLRESDLTDCDFTSADLSSVDMSQSRVVGASFRNTDVRDARFRSLQGFTDSDWIGVDIQGINLSGAYRLRRFVVDQNYLKEFRESSRAASWLYYLWWVSSDCGRSLTRWGIWILVQTVGFAWLYAHVGVDFGPEPTLLSPLYFSVVTFTTLGYGDITPVTGLAQSIAMAEVLFGYVMLGGLLSIFSNLIARRGD